MKKIYKLWLLPLLLLVLVGCSQTTLSPKTTSSSSTEAVKTTAKLIVKKDEKVLEKNVTFKKGESVLDLLKTTYTIEDKDGFITSIDGLKQDESANKYWMFKINDEVASKGAKDITVKNGDKIEFYQETFNN
ncbi:MAG: DUF4430 domain-containing protein [Streptococcus sp.]|nr:DUF4430 domain-containing protein [Streptococcus sp.]